MEILENEKNMTIIENEGFLYMFSYNSKIAIYCRETESLVIGKKWNYSQTTIKHLKAFINNYTGYKYENKQQFEKEMEKVGKIYQSLYW